MAVQEEWIAEWEAKRRACPQCGGDTRECGDEDVEWFPQRSICYATAAQEVAARTYDERFKDQSYHSGTFEPGAKEFSTEKPWHYMDGVNIWVSTADLSPDDDFI